MSKRVLIVDDDLDIREALGEVLASEGFEVLLARNGTDALRQLDAGSSPEIILLDLTMPEMNGREFRDAQLRRPSWAAIPVVVVSADTNVRSAASDMGVAGFIRKPLELDELLQTVNRLAY
jgi:two-component system response regulator MprA